MKKFNMINASSKFAICGLPLRVDTYKGVCGFNCQYCFSNNRKIMEFEKNLSIGNIDSAEKRFKRILIDKDWDNTNFIDCLIANKCDAHIGGMCDPLQPIEEKYDITKQLFNLLREYDYPALLSTKSNTLYGVEADPKIHSFQLSITNIDNRTDLEPGVAPIESRVRFFNELKDKGFKVGIRIQPFIPNTSSLGIIETFKDADHFTIEGIKMVPQNKENIESILTLTELEKKDFKNLGLYNLKPEIREELYKPFIDYFKENNISYSISDNDMRYLSNNKCCCGDALVKNPANFNTTALIQKYGMEYTIENTICEAGCFKDCIVKNLFTSNRQSWGSTVEDWFNSKYNSKRSPYSPQFMYKGN